jgi:hypothetical protein
VPIIINEFEILPEAVPPPAPGPSAPALTPAPALGPEEIHRALARHHDRLERVKAD